MSQGRLPMGTNKNDTPLLEVRHLKKYFKTGYGMPTP